MAGEGEGEPEGQTGALHAHVVQEVGNAEHDVVEKLPTKNLEFSTVEDYM